MAYTASKSITIDHTKVGASDSVNFPFLFSGSYAYLATVANAGDVTSASGYDIIFTSDSAGTVLLNWEIESYDPVTGTVNIWVKVPTVSHTVDTVIYVFYGNAAVVTFQGGAAGSVWDANFGAVYHLGTNLGLPADSTVNANNGVNTAVTATTGQIDGGGSFNGTTSVITVPNSASVSPTTTASFSAWVNPIDVSTRCPILGKTISDYLWEIGTFSSGQDAFYDGVVWHGTGPGAFLAGVWQQGYMTLDGTNITFYRNGAQIGQVSQTTPLPTSGLSLDIGANGSGNFLSGSLDELRISNIARSADWILAEYNNQSSPSTFYILTAPAPNPISISPTSDEQGFTGNVTVTGTNFTPSVTENFIAFVSNGQTSITGGTPTPDATTGRNNQLLSHGVSVGGSGTATFTWSGTHDASVAIAAFDGLVAPTFVQGLSQLQAFGTSNAVPYGVDNTVGNTLVVLSTKYTNALEASTIADSQGNVWLPLFSQVAAISGYWQSGWYAPNCKAGANTVTVSWLTAGEADTLIAEYSPIGNVTQVQGLVDTTGTTATTPALLGPATLSFSGTGITVNSYSVQNATTITANITITSSAALTARDVIVTNADAQTATLAAAFTITGIPVPISILPTTGTQGATFNITMTGTNFSAGTLSFSGTGITVNSYSVQTSTHITANITVNILALIGARDVTVTNTGGQTGTLAGGFTVLENGFIISGSLGVAGAGALVTLSGAVSATTTADSSGNYSFVGFAAGTYSVTVSKVGVAFSPTSRTVVVTSADVTGVNFVTFKPRRGTVIIGTNLGTKIIR